MARPAAVTPEQIRTTVLAMLAEAGDDGATAFTGSTASTASVTHERFRRAVSVRRLRARLGAGDPAVLSRALNAIEAELVQAGLTQLALPGLPEAIAEQMRALWQAAVSVQLDDVMRLKTEARDAMDTAQTARHDADLRVEMLRVELAELRAQLSARDAELATARAECRAATATLAEREQAAGALNASANTAARALEEARADHATALAAVHARYEGLSKRLLQETEHQRHALASERDRLGAQLTDAATRISALEGLRERLLDELATERDAHRQAAAEAAALTTVVTEQRHALQALETVQAAQTRQARPVQRTRPAAQSMPSVKPVKPIRAPRPATVPGSMRDPAAATTRAPPSAITDPAPATTASPRPRSRTRRRNTT
ncbi:Chromosome partition protein Smc [Caballeronia calidae]|uniref:Chromosome partition protein Smc n=1 Tax=Caballeronia calidae TaxID=1777139 RepID=A0A158EHI8_9BURK|nr:DNA-binding protein [Caballeronia calidae]SAL06160.1 Chromosome partition protein Smc [Caballeronia calidae]